MAEARLYFRFVVLALCLIAASSTQAQSPCLRANSFEPLAISNTPLGVAGFVVMLGSAAFAMQSRRKGQAPDLHAVGGTATRRTRQTRKAGFIDRLEEPLPTEWFRAEKPEAYARLLKHPQFLMVRARPAVGTAG